MRTFFNKFSRQLGSLLSANTSSTAALSPPSIVAFVTDVEGDYEYWNRYISISKVLDRNEKGDLRLKDGAHFVFGGDAVDQGPGDLRFLKDIINLHQNYPDRVHVVLGNRDLNKMRIAQELSDSHCKNHPWKTYRGVFWRGDSGIDHNEPDTLPNRLRWILKYSMGSDRAFELRRQELKELKEVKEGSGNLQITDDEVVDSFINLFQPNGLLREYLKIGRLGVILGDSLFVHGGLSQDVVGWLPPFSSNVESSIFDVEISSNEIELNARTWIHRLNEFCSLQVKLFCQAIDDPNSFSNISGNSWAMEGGYGTKFGGGDLMQYGMGWKPDRSRNNTVVYRDWIAKDSNPSYTGNPPKEKHPSLPLIPDSYVVQYLNQANINRVICGHKPHGDASLVIKSKDEKMNNNELTVITMDTSYSGSTKVMEVDEDGSVCPLLSSFTPNSSFKRRGCAVSELLVYHEDNNGSFSSRAFIHGIDAAGDKYISEPDDPSSFVGRISSGGWIVKGKRVKDDKLILGRLVGWDSQNMFVDKDKYIKDMC
jgi:hypothetical protein